jgi:ferrochelatase
VTHIGLKQYFEAAEAVENHNSDLTETTPRDRVAVLLAGYGEVESFRELSLYKQAATK